MAKVVSNKVEVVNDIIQNFVDLKRVIDESTGKLKSQTDLVLQEIKKLGVNTVNVVGGRVTLKQRTSVVFDVKELESFLKRRKADLSSFQTQFIDMSLVTPEFLEEHGLLDEVRRFKYDIDKIKEVYGSDALKKVVCYDTVESVSVTLTKG